MHVQELESSDSGVYVLSKVYTVNDRWTDVMKVKGLMSKKEMHKDPGSSAVEVNRKISEFLVVQKNCSHIHEIWAVLSILMKQLHFEGPVVLLADYWFL